MPIHLSIGCNKKSPVFTGDFLLLYAFLFLPFHIVPIASQHKATAIPTAMYPKLGKQKVNIASPACSTYSVYGMVKKVMAAPTTLSQFPLPQ